MPDLSFGVTLAVLAAAAAHATWNAMIKSSRYALLDLALTTSWDEFLNAYAQ